MNSIRKIWAVSVLLICCACGAPTTVAPLPTQASVGASATAELPKPLTQPLNFSGDDFFTSNPFDLNAAGKVDIVWEYSGDGPFAFWILSNDEFSGNPKYDRILVKDVDDTASSGQTTIDLIAGNYVIEVEMASGPWQITISAQP
jgi:hypothetical protein